jgi:hypothetical protein
MNSSKGKKKGVCLKFCNNVIESRPLKYRVADDEPKERKVRTCKPLSQFYLPTDAQYNCLKKQF